MGGVIFAEVKVVALGTEINAANCADEICLPVCGQFKFFSLSLRLLIKFYSSLHSLEMLICCTL